MKIETRFKKFSLWFARIVRRHRRCMKIPGVRIDETQSTSTSTSRSPPSKVVGHRHDVPTTSAHVVREHADLVVLRHGHRRPPMTRPRCKRPTPFQGANATGEKRLDAQQQHRHRRQLRAWPAVRHRTQPPPNVDASSWTTSLTSLSVVACTDTQFGDGGCRAIAASKFRRPERRHATCGCAHDHAPLVRD